jgi:hypothetical protein
LKRASRFVINLDFFGDYSGFGFEALSRHEKVEQGYEVRMNLLALKGGVLDPTVHETLRGSFCQEIFK